MEALKAGMKNEYIRLQCPMSSCSFNELVAKVEVDLSRNLTFKLLHLSLLVLIQQNEYFYANLFVGPYCSMLKSAQTD